MSSPTSTAQALEDRCATILTGHHPMVQGAALASLLACWLAGHPAGVREALLAEHVKVARELLPLYVKERNS